jgi:hypothetical protein
MNAELKTINQKFVSLEHIDDQELDALLSFYAELTNMVSGLGREFNFFYGEITRRREMLEMYKLHRSLL